eukprot:GHVU01122720.1.p1 GENE.GHVU01122720.1~~GHVU01122720.1.p1  ORF type:complete len:136 (+),score=8.47 GHVU01122720.1:928-1335(+)
MPMCVCAHARLRYKCAHNCHMYTTPLKRHHALPHSHLHSLSGASSQDIPCLSPPPSPLSSSSPSRRCPLHPPRLLPSHLSPPHVSSLHRSDSGGKQHETQKRTHAQVPTTIDLTIFPSIGVGPALTRKYNDDGRY